MFTQLIESVSALATTLIDTLGYAGIILGMAIESFNIPLPSEVLMTFGGALAAQGRFGFWWVVLAGAGGELIGSTANYALGKYGGRPVIERYGKYVLIRHRDLDIADRWFAKYGLAAVFFGRIVPVVRTFISFPAGVSGVPIGRFLALTFAGSFLWCTLLTYLGMKFGQNYATVIHPLFQRFDLVIGVLLVLAVAWYVERHLEIRAKLKKRRAK